MELEPYVPLCERIRDHCRQRHWYGPDYSPEYRMPDYGPGGILHFSDGYEEAEKAMTGFLRSPVSQDEVRTTEDRAGFAFPPALRAIYILIANGSFGPGFGILGVPTIASTLTKGSWRLPEHFERNLEQEPGAWFIAENEPAGLLTLCVWDDTYGCYFKVDIATGRVYDVWRNRGFSPEPSWNDAIAIVYHASSVEEWIEQWLQEKADPYKMLDVEEEMAESSAEDLAHSPDFEPSEEDLEWYRQHFAFDDDDDDAPAT